ncbi:Amino acid permease [Spirosomataceae bacterium TFI 002]|nr:Amino acid permease [Spirosomataceae bacterium TFI 002]
MKASKNLISSNKLGIFSIWAIGVGMVISGESFGWNLGWAITGPVWFFVPVFVAALMYFGLVQSLIELACVYPTARSPHDYVAKAFGEKAGAFVAVAILFEFLFATPAIASSIGEYLGFLIDALPMAPWIATAFLAVFSIINLFELNLGVRLLVILTLLAIAELFLYQGSVFSSFEFKNLQSFPNSGFSFQSFMESIPFAIWLFLAIEGISLMTRDIAPKNFRRTISRGYYYAFFTLLILAILVLTLAAGGIDWNSPASMGILEENHPMPASLALILGREHVLVQIFTFIGLFGLIASLQGVALAATAQLEPLLPKKLFKGQNKRAVASGLVFLVSLMAIWSSQTGFLIELSVFGAVCMYLSVSISLVLLRRKKTMDVESDKWYKHQDFNATLSYCMAGLTAIIAIISIFAFARIQFVAFIVFMVCGVVFAYFNTANKDEL